MSIQVGKDTKRLEAYCFVEHEFILNDKHKELVKTISTTLAKAEDGFHYFSTLKSKKKTLYIRSSS